MPEKKSPKSAAAAKPKSKPKPSGIAKKACDIKMKHKVDGHVKPAGKNCKKLINQGESSCGACHAIKDNGKYCEEDVGDARSNYCAIYHVSFRG